MHKHISDIIFRYTLLRHCNARGCEYGRRETLVQCCSNAGLHRRQWRHRFCVWYYASGGVVPRLRSFHMLIDYYTLSHFPNQ